MGSYKNINGVLSPIAGRGKAEYGASTVRKGNITFTAASPQWNVVDVTFDEPMPDADYLVDFIITSDEPSMGSCTPYMIPTKSATGFTFKMYCGASRGVTIAYTAYKLYTDNEYNELLTLPDEVGHVDHLYDHSEGIASNDDLNDYIVPGNYSCGSSAICQTLSNKPSSLNQAFSLKVEIRGAYSASGINTLFQTIYKVNNNAAGGNDNCPIYVRSRAYNVSTWSNWKRQLSTSDIVELQVPITRVPISAGQAEIVLDVPNVPTGYKLLSISGFETGRVDSLRVYGCHIHSNNPSTRTFKVRIPLYAGAAIPELNGYIGVLAIPAD